jgi:hypothetical protein
LPPQEYKSFIGFVVPKKKSEALMQKKLSSQKLLSQPSPKVLVPSLGARG